MIPVPLPKNYRTIRKEYTDHPLGLEVELWYQYFYQVILKFQKKRTFLVFLQKKHYLCTQIALFAIFNYLKVFHFVCSG